jgi:hypothetical protein
LTLIKNVKFFRIQNVYEIHNEELG